MHLIYRWFFQVVWLAFVLYWWISALFVKRIQHGEPDRERAFRFLVTAGAAWLMYSPNFLPGFLNRQVFPQSFVTFFTGAFLLVAGLGFAVWARVHLGAYWSAMVAVKEGHRLIRSGPYRLVRHPIYTGLLTALSGTALAIGQVRSLLAAAIFIVVYRRKSQHEERLLAAEFADEYPAYRKEVGALIPSSGAAQKVFWCGVATVIVLVAASKFQ